MSSISSHCPTCGQSVPLDGRLLVDTAAAAVQRGARRIRVCKGHSMTLLSALHGAFPRCVSYERIIHAIWGHDPNGGPLAPRAVLHVLIARMRPALRELGVGIVTERGDGLRLTIDPNWQASIEMEKAA